MPLTLVWGTVTAVSQRLEELVRLEVDGVPCVAYPRLTGTIEEGDVVLVNAQARTLELGSGGFDIVHANLTRGLNLAAVPDAHVIALPYTPVQAAAVFGEEDTTTSEAADLDGMPVVCCSLHSQVGPACAGLGRGARVAYVQVGGGALPVSLSDTVRALRARGLIGTSVAVAPCVDADVQCVTAASALLWVQAAGYDAAVCGIGPGIVGTGTSFGHGGVAAAEVANAASALGGRPIIAPRVSFGDPRERHQGLSHHTRAVLTLALGEVRLAWPGGLDLPEDLELEPDTVPVDGWRETCEGLTLSHMGRGVTDEPWFFAAAFAAGRLARRLVDDSRPTAA